MSEPTSTENDATKPGPANPAAEGADAPTPPGGPQRQDGVGGAKGRADAPTDDDDGRSDEGGTIPIEDEQPDPEPAGGEDGLQEENAETSQDQPST